MDSFSPPEIYGLFWLPATPDVRASGKLYRDDDDNLELQLLGPLSENVFEAINSKGPAFRLLGVSSNGKQITLDECTYLELNVHFPGWAVCRLRVRMMYVGVHFEAGEVVAFDAIAFHSDALDEWLHYHEITVAFDLTNPKGAYISYSPRLAQPLELSREALIYSLCVRS